MRIEAQPAFVLHATPYRESSLLVELMTRDHGRIGLVARGVRGPRKQSLRAALQPLQAVLVDYVQRGDLGTLSRAEAAAPMPMPVGDALLAGLYASELLLRLAPRGDALPEAFDRFAETLVALAEAPAHTAWTLRRFERDLIGILGYGLPLDCDADGAPLEPGARYRLDPERGPLRERQAQVRSVTGAALLALDADTEPGTQDLRELRDALRGVIAHHLGPRPLRSWGLLGEFARLRPPAS
ncbi:DNA repair protein RecO [Coralloluteibacterium thermophilus]|uniref:DNA repair protein RecO n=1 Tax=Coralloluteibacterium thermophilum TaxID=2707049 RepID=A0ABV9NJI8_9GAMM